MEQTVKIDNNSFFVTVKESLNAGHRVKFRVAGNSMRPFLREGDVVCISAVSIERAKIGSIVLGYWQQGYVLHRLVKCQDRFTYLAGDNNLGQLEKIPSNHLIAVVLECYRNDELLSKQSSWDRLLGMGWYYIRPLRRVGAKIRRLLR